MEIDLSTIEMGRLGGLPVVKLPPTYKMGDMGMGCALDPPGYPTYMMRPVYTQWGNSPRRGPIAVIDVDGKVRQLQKAEWDSDIAIESNRQKLEIRLRRLWKPLPLDHPRTLAWISQVYSNFRNCYYSADEKDSLLIWPVPYYKLKQYQVDERWRDEVIEAHKAEVDAYNKEVREGARSMATPNNHMGVRLVRSFYIEHQYRLDLIVAPEAAPYSGDWWHLYAERPTSDKCPGTPWRKHSDDVFCQFCGNDPRGVTK